MTDKLVGICIGLAIAGCGKGDKGGDKASSAPATIDVAPVNAAIPAAWKGKIEFVTRQLGDRHPVSVPAPKDWKVGFLKDSVEPPDDNKAFGFATSFSAGQTCNGECKSKSAAEWEAAANRASFDNMLAHKPAPNVIKDDKHPGSRLMIAKDQYTDGNVNHTSVLAAFWKDGADHMYYCNVTIPDESKDLIPAFEQACMKLATEW